MSFTSLVSSTLAILDTSKNNYSNVSVDRRLPKTFHESGQGLLLIEQVLQHVELQINGRNTPGERGDTMGYLEACKAKATLTERLFIAVAQAPETERFEYYKKSTRQEGECNLVENLVIGMMNDVCDLAKDSAIEAATKDQVRLLREAIEKLSRMEPSILDKRSGNIFSSYGSGNQFNAPGGTQNNNTGSGHQFSGANFNGPIHFGSNPS